MGGTTLHENKHVCDYLSVYETLLLRNVVPFATGVVGWCDGAG